MFLEQSIGIDFRDDTVRLVRLGKGFRTVSLVDYIIKKYPFTLDKAMSPDNMDELVNDIGEFALRNTKPDHVVLGIPRQKVILRQLILPTVNKQQLQEMIGYEIKRHLPVPTQEVYFDYQLTSQESENTNRIFLGLVKTEDLDFYLNVLNRAQLVPTCATVSSFALCGKIVGINQGTVKEANLYIDIGTRLIECVAVHGDNLLFTRSLEMEEGHLVDDFSISRIKEAARIPEEEEIGEEAKLDENVRRLGDELVTLLSQSFANVNAEDDMDIKRISMSGQGVYDIHIADYFKDTTEVLIPNIFGDLTDKSIPGRTSSALAVATGLAKRGFEEKYKDLNLLPNRLRVKRSSNSLKFTIILLILLFVLGIGIAYIGNPLAFPDNVKLTEDMKEFQLPTYCFYLPKLYKLKAINSIREQIKPKVKEVKEIDKNIKSVEEEIGRIHEVMSTRTSKLEILRELTDIIPDDAWLDRATITNEKIEIRGVADAAADLIGIIEKSVFFENAIFPTTISKKRGTNKEQFRINADIEKKGEKK
ncbi:MAG: pilus assembly protein PilM [bacterium]